MPNVEVIFFQESEGRTPPLVEWLDGLRQKARIKCLVGLARMEALGHELRRPEAEYLRGGIYELRASYQGVHYHVSEFQHDFKGPAADYDYIDASEELLEPVRLLLTCVQEIERAIRTGQKAIDTHSAED